MTTLRRFGSRIHLILPELNANEAAALHYVLSDVIAALWDVHGDQLSDALAERYQERDVEDPDPDDIFAIAEHDGDESPD